MLDMVVKRTLDQNIHSHFFKKSSPLLSGENHLAGRVNGKKHCLLPQFLTLQNLFHQLPVPAVNTVKFSHRDRTA